MKINITFYLILIILLSLNSCVEDKVDNTLFSGYQIGSWKSLDSTEDIVFQDSLTSVFITPDSIVGSPILFGENNKAGIISSFNFSKNPIEFYKVYLDNEGLVKDSAKYFVNFIGKDTLQLLLDNGKKGNKDLINFSSKSSLTYVKTDSTSAIPQRLSEISTMIYKLYNNFSFGMAGFDDIGFMNMPVYGNMLEISLGMGMIRLYTLKYSFAAENIKILNLTEKEAIVKYTLLIIETDNKIKEKNITTKLRKINNEWRVYWKDIFGTGTI